MGSGYIDLTEDYDASLPDWDGDDKSEAEAEAMTLDSDSPRDILPAPSTTDFLKANKIIEGAVQSLHTDDVEWRPTLAGSDPRVALRAKVSYNKLPAAKAKAATAAAASSSTRPAAKKREADAEDAPMSGGASGSGMPLKSPRQ